MMTRLKSAFKLVFAFMFFVALSDAGYAAPRIFSKKKIVLVTSFSMRLPWVLEFVEAFNSSLPAERFDIENVSFSVEQNPDFQPKESDVKWFLEKVNSDDVDAVVALDSSAMRIIRENYDNIPAKLDIMLAGDLSGVNSDFAKRNSKVFLIRKFMGFEKNIGLGLDLIPRAKKIICVSDASEEGMVFDKMARDKWEKLCQNTGELGLNLQGVEMEFVNGSEFSTIDMVKRISQAGDDFFILFFRWFSVKDAGRSSQKYYLDLVSEMAKERVIFFYRRSTEKAIGGYALSAAEFGNFVASKTTDMVVGTLDERNPELYFYPNLTINKAVFSEKNFSKKVLDGKDVHFYNIKPSFWERAGLKPVVLILSIFSFLMVSVFVLFYRSMRSAAKNSIMFSNMPTNVYVFLSDGEIIYSYSEYPEIKKAKSLLDFNNEFFPIFRSRIGEIKNGEKISFEYMHGGKMRRAVVAKLPNSAFARDAYIGTTLDITDLENARRKERELSSHLSTTLSSIGDAVITTDEHEVVTFINPVACALTGFSDSEAKGKKLDSIFSLIFEDGKPHSDSAVRTAMSSKEIVKVSEHLELLSKDGERYYISNSAAPIIINGKLAGAVLVFRDVSEEYRKRRETAAKNSLLHTATSMTNISYFQCDKNWNIIGDFDKSFMGSNGKGGAAEMFDIIIPEDRLEFISRWNELVLGEKSDIEYTYRSDHFGSRRYFQAHASTTPYEKGEDARYLVVIQEITAIKKNEQRLQYANTVLKNILDNIPCSISVKNYSDFGKYVMVNSQFYNFLAEGNQSNAVGKTSSELFDSDTAARIEKTDAEIAKSGGRIDAVLTLPGRNGDFVKLRSIKVAEKMENGEIYIFSADLDVTDLLRNQDLLEVQTRNMGIINECLQRILVLENTDDAFKNILQTLCNNLDVDRAFIYSLDEESQTFKTFSFWLSENSPDFVETIPQSLSKLWIEHLNSDKYFRISSFEEIKGWRSQEISDFMEKDKSKSFILTGVYYQGKLVGIIGVDTVFSERVFDQNDELLLQNTSRIAEVLIERSRNSKKTKHLEQMRTMILNSVPIPIVLFNPSKEIIALNNAALLVMDGSEEEILKRSREENLKFIGFTEENSLVSMAFESKLKQKRDVVLKGKEYMVQATPILGGKGEVSYVIETFFDVTELNELNRKYMDAMRVAQEADKAKSNFLATMSHEIRTPLNAVIGYSELTQNSQLTQEERVHNLKNINFAANTLLSLINDILDFSKLETDNTEIFKSPVDMVKLANEFRGVFGYATRNKNINFDLEIINDAPILMMDALRLKQVLMNIVGNAVKFTSSGGVKVTFSFNKKGEKFEVEISVKDTGIGIAPEHIETIFNPFVQEYTSRVRGRGAYEGTGLGLSIAKRLVERMGGKISVESTPGKGSEFKISFVDVEIYNADSHNSEVLKSPTEEKSKSIKEGLKILIVDDVHLNIKVLAKMLRTLNVDVFDALSGAEALEKLEKIKPDIIMTDLWMPEMDGEEFAKKVKADPKMANIPIVLVTADTQTENKDKLFDAILLKPISIKGIADVLMRVHAG